MSPRQPTPILASVYAAVRAAPEPITSADVALHVATRGLPGVARPDVADALLYLLAANLIRWVAPNRYAPGPLGLPVTPAMERAFARGRAARRRAERGAR